MSKYHQIHSGFQKGNTEVAEAIRSAIAVLAGSVGQFRVLESKKIQPPESQDL